jgi:hypothetical protein
MKTFLFIAFTFLLSAPIFAQQDTTVYDFPETEAVPKQDLNDFYYSLFGIFDDIETTEDQDLTCLGRMRILFIVEIDGSITHLKCIDNCGHTFDSIRLTDRFMEKWIPATNNGKAVRSKCHIPINICFL